MSNTNTGGPAFPHSSEDPDGQIRTHWHGMTLRDYFAAKAMQAYLPIALERNAPSADFSAAAYKMADAMLKAREA